MQLRLSLSGPSHRRALVQMSHFPRNHSILLSRASVRLTMDASVPVDHRSGTGGVMRQFWPFLLMAVALAVLAAGCGGGSRGEHPQGDDSQSLGLASNQAGDASPASVPAANRHRSRPWYRKGLRTVGFQSPTGNIRCALESGERHPAPVQDDEQPEGGQSRSCPPA
jgi:hypothetical protein